MRRLGAPVLALALGLAAPTMAQTPDLVQTHLSLDLRLDYSAGTVFGRAGIEIENAGATPVEQVSFTLGRLMRVESVSIAGQGHEAWIQEVVVFEDWPRFQVAHLVVDLPGALEPGKSTRIDVAYAGVLVGYTETGMQYVRDRVAPEFTVLRSDAKAWPTLGWPSLTSMRAQRHEDFTFDLALTVPDPDQVVATGVPGTADPVDRGVRWTFASADPTPFLLIAVAPYEVLEGTGARIFHFAEDAEGAARVAVEVEAAESLYTGWFGDTRGERPVTIMEIPAGWGSQASLVGGIIQTADAFRSGESMPQLYHELAHLRHPRELETPADRWNEGLATFLQWRVASERDGEPLNERARQVAERVRSDDGANPVTAPLVEYGELGRTDAAYRHGALFFYSLFEALGAAGFDRCMGEYFAAFADSGSTNDDFARSLTACSSDATPVFETWFHSTRWIERLRQGESLEALVTRPGG